MALQTDILLERAIQERIATALETQVSEEGADSFCVSYLLRTKDYGAGWTEDIQSARARGKVVAVSLIDTTEAFVGTTSIGPTSVGIQGGDDNAYSISEEGSTIGDNVPETLESREGVIGTIPATDDLLITGAINVGGAITGIASVVLTIKYFV